MPIILMLFIPPVLLIAYYPIILKVNPHPMPRIDYLIFGYMMSLSIMGAYQLFFWVQTQNFRFKTRCFAIGLDEKLPFIPQLIWVYSIGYYCFLGLMALGISSFRQGAILIFSGFMQLVIHSIFFYFMPTVTPKNFRQYEVTNLSRQFLKVVQTYDNGRCCFPSLHCSAMAFTGYFLYPTIGVYAFIPGLLITSSCMLVKQHQLLDFILSAPIAFFVYHAIYLNLA